MDIQETRRENLRRWVKKNGTPAKEKSYFSQVLGGVSPFGEKAARRIEEDYGMGSGYLDSAAPEIPQGKDALDEAVRLLSLYRSASDVGRQFIMKAAESAEKAPD